MEPEKIYVWGFPGIGKSSVSAAYNAVDADSAYFRYKFKNGIPSSLLRRGVWDNVSLSPDFPANYLSYINKVSADMVFLNCHISVLDHLDKDSVIVVYPSKELKGEYLDRYIARGDNDSYIEYMDECFEDIIDCLEKSPYRKLVISEPDVYLQDLINGGHIMNRFMTKQELTKLLGESIDLGIYTPPDVFKDRSSTDLSQLVFEGELSVDIESLKRDLELKKEFLEKERITTERRGGLSRDELADRIMQGIVNGALGIRYAEIAPYSHGYEVTFGDCELPGSTRNFTNRWECYGGDLFSVPYSVADAISLDRQNNEVFGASCGPVDIHKILKRIDEMESRKISSFTPEAETDFQRAVNSYTYPYRSSVATVMDVHAGKGLDGIVQHHYHGTYSTMTPVKQNSLVEALVCLKGFCLDCITTLDVGIEDSFNIVQYLKKHGTDISTPEKLEEWIKSNPDKCALSSNRSKKVPLNNVIESASEKVSDITRIQDNERTVNNNADKEGR